VFDLEKAVKEAPAGGVVSIPPGTHSANVLVDKPLSLIGMGTVVLDGERHGSVLRVHTKGVVKIAGLLIAGGRTTMAGGGIALLDGELELFQCTLRFNEAPVNGGGGLYVRGQVARVRECRFEGNTGRQGGAILVDRSGRLELRDSLVVQNAAVDGGGVRVRESASAELVGCTLADNKVVGETPTGGALSLSGSTTATPSLTVSNCIVSERTQGPELIHNFAGAPGTLTLTRNLLPEWCRPFGGDNLFGPAGFVMSGSEPYSLKPDSKAVAAGDPAVLSGKDVLGRPRSPAGRADLGAFAMR
jgi:hypothetical protein